MKLASKFECVGVLILGLALSACATEDFASDLSKPNFGRLELNSDDNVDARLLQNGLYLPKPFAATPYAAAPFTPSCLTADYRCLRQAQSSWSSFDP